MNPRRLRLGSAVVALLDHMRAPARRARHHEKRREPAFSISHDGQALTVKLKKKQEDQRKHMMAFVERFRYKASKARQAQSRLKALSKLEPIAELVEDRVAPFFFPNPEKAIAPPLV